MVKCLNISIHYRRYTVACGVIHNI